MKQGSQRLLITPYFYPADPPDHPPVWRTMCKRIRLSRAQAIIVMNPSNGKFRKADPSFTEAMRACRRRGHRVIGYVTTGRGKDANDNEVRGGRRRLSGVKLNVDRYYTKYPGIDGIFFDEMANNPDKVGTRDAAAGELRNRDYYKRAYEHVKTKPGRRIVVGNPGAAAGSDWQVKTPVADILVTFEGPTARVEHAVGVNGDPEFVKGYDTFTPPAWTRNYKPKRFANLVYRAAKPSHPADGRPSITSVCQLSAARRAGLVSVTSDNFIIPDPDRNKVVDHGPAPPVPEADSNPWDTKPEDELLACPTLRRIPVTP